MKMNNEAIPVVSDELLDNEITVTSDSENELLDDSIKTRADGETEVLKSSDENFVKLPLGRALTLAETYPLTASSDVKIIVLLGPTSCGKTTLETTIYQMFQMGSLGDYYFAGSETLVAYEQRAFATRTISNSSDPMTPRTVRGASDIFLHLKLWHTKNNKMQNFLFADLAGEELKDKIADVNAMKKDFWFIKHADYIISVLDGELLIDSNERLGVVEDAKLLLRTICDANLYKSNTKFQLIISKHDLILKAKEDDMKIEEFINIQKNFIQKNLKRNLDFFDIAAMPIENKYCDIGHGIENLFNSWNCTDAKQFDCGIHNQIVNSEINKLRYKLLGDQL